MWKTLKKEMRGLEETPKVIAVFTIDTEWCYRQRHPGASLESEACSSLCSSTASHVTDGMRL